MHILLRTLYYFQMAMRTINWIIYKDKISCDGKVVKEIKPNQIDFEKAKVYIKQHNAKAI